MAGRKLRVVMIAAEATPYAKVGGLGDVVGALPRALEQLGLELAIMIPAYGNNSSVALRGAPCIQVSGFDVPMDSSVEHAEIFQTRMDGTRIDVYQIASQRYFQRDGIYDDPSTKEGYLDNMERFLFFMKASVELIQRLGTPFDIIHCHDSHTALVPGLIDSRYGGSRAFSGIGTLFTIHNLAYQGLYPKEALDFAGIPPVYFYPNSPFEYWNQVNFMKAGIEIADKVNTVSPTYSEEIQASSEMGLGLEGVLLKRKADLSGIINGIDYEEWDPTTDPLIPACFSEKDFSGKGKCKEHLLNYFNLSRSKERVPLIGIVSRLADQKGFDLIAEAIDDITSLNLKMVILGTGQQQYHDLFRSIAARYPGKIGVQLTFDNAMAHRIEAGCDMFLMPSKYEPCGLNQLYSFRYGTIPIVRKTGGLADTVIPYDQKNSTGFSFSEYSSREMLGCIKQALEIFSDETCWRDLMVRAMRQDWSWSNSAKQYKRLYRSIYSIKHPDSDIE